MGDVKQWLSVKIQRALGLESVQEASPIVSSIMAKTDARDIENSLIEWLGTDETAQEIISGYFKKISIPRAVAQPAQPAPSVYTHAAASAARSVQREGVYEPKKQDDDDLGYGALAKTKKKGNKSSNRDKYQLVELGPEGRSLASGPIKVMKKVKKGSKNDPNSDEANQGPRERAICGCQARLHPFVNNCLRCGRIVCLQEDVGPCFYCHHYVTPQGIPQVAPFTTTPTPEWESLETPGGPTETPKDTPTPTSKEAEGLKRAQDNLARLLQFDRTMAERTTVYDDQADYFDMTNRWISADERKRLAAKEAALLKAKETSVNTLVLDFAGRSVVTTMQTSEESHHKFKEELLAEMKLEDERKKMMDREEAEEHQKAELLRVKGNLKQRADGTVFVLPALDIPAPEFVTRKKEEKAASGAKKPAASSHSSHHSAATASSSAANSSFASSPSLSLASSAATIPKPASRLQTDFYPEIELDSLDSDSSTTVSSKKSSGLPKNSGTGAETDSEISKPVPEVELAPNAVKIRGVVEGFSGKIWTLDDRLDMLTWMAAQGGNFYMWAPVDDPMHRRLWNHLFPDEDVANMRASIQKAKSLGVEFCLGIRPVDFDFRSTHHIDALARKILQAYEKLGCRSFSFIFGDGDRGVPSGCRSLGSAQSELVNTIVNVVDEFLKLKNAPETDGSVVASSSSDSSSATQIRWLICPTVYASTLESGRQVGLLNYVRELNKALDSRFEILWSGPESPAHSIEKDYLSQMRAFFGEKRRLFFWDRLPSFPAPFDLPVHSADSFDYALHMHQFVEVYERRSPQLSHFFEGALVSTMAAPIPSRVLLSTSLSFFKDPSKYDSKKALIPALQRHVLNPAQNTDSLAASFAALLEISPSTPMSRHQKAPACLNRGDQEERGFFNGLKTHLNKLEKAPDGAFPALAQFSPLFNLIKELVSMNLNYYEYLKDPKNAGLVTKSIRDLRASLIPVIFTEHDLTTYRAQLYAHPIADKSFRGDVQRTFTKFRAHHQLGQKDSDAKELEVRLAAEATLSLRELEAYLINEYKKEDIIAWRIFLNKLFFRDSTKHFLEKMPSVTSPASATPNTKVVEARNARMKVKVAEEEKRRVVALKFAIASGTVENPDDSSDDDDEGAPSSRHATSSSTSTSSAATSSPAKKVYRTEVKDLPVPGLRYIRDFLTPEQEAKLLADLDSKEWDGSISRRMQQYGFKFQHRPNDQSEYNTPRLEIAPLMPAFLKAVADELLNGKYMPVKADQVIVNEYTPGQGIRHHVDNPLAFEDVVVSISLGSAALMEFKHSKTDEVVSWLLEPRSLLILTKDARYQWSHSIPPRTEDVWNGIVLGRERRVSVTMRKVKHVVAKELYDAVTKKK